MPYISISTRNTLRGGQFGFQGSISGGEWEFFFSPPRQERLCFPPRLLCDWYQWLFPWSKAVAAWIWQLHLVPSSKSGDIPPLPNTTSRRGAQFEKSTGTTLYLRLMQ